jgi:hypothetical protein
MGHTIYASRNFLLSTSSRFSRQPVITAAAAATRTAGRSGDDVADGNGCGGGGVCGEGGGGGGGEGSGGGFRVVTGYVRLHEEAGKRPAQMLSSCKNIMRN